MVIYPVTTWRLALGAVVRGLDSIQANGHQRDQVGHMQTRAELYDTLRYADYAAFDSDIYNFKV